MILTMKPMMNSHLSSESLETRSSHVPRGRSHRGIFLLFFALLISTSLYANDEAPPVRNANFWLETSLKRIFPTTQPGSTNLHLLVARQSKTAFQACLQNCTTQPLFVDCKVIGADDLKPQVRLVGFEPVWHHTPNTSDQDLDGVGNIPGLVPDPLWPMQRANAGTHESRSFWITLNIPADAKPGLRELTVELSVVKGE